MTLPIELLSAFDPFGPDGGAGELGRLRRYVLLDVFASTPLQGNQLAVLLDARELEGVVMQAIALELRLSETVFMLPPQAQGDVRIRIFTPNAELPFAGHPVLGAAAVASRSLGRPEVVLETGMGPVVVDVSHEGRLLSAGRMSQSIPTWDVFDRQAELLAALGARSSSLPIEIYSNGPHHVFVGLDSDDEVAALSPDLGALAHLGELGVSCFAGGGRHWKSRMFAPALGVPEDPATGSAAGPLAVHLARHGRIGFGQQVEIRQGEEIGRPSLLNATVDGSADAITAVEVAGRAILVGRGEMCLEAASPL